MNQDTILVRRRSNVEIYNFTADIHYSFGFFLPLLLTRGEAAKTMAVAKVN